MSKNLQTRRHPLSVAALACVALAAGTATEAVAQLATPAWTVEVVRPAADLQTEVYGLNNLGQVVGFTSIPTTDGRLLRPFIYGNGAFTLLSVLVPSGPDPEELRAIAVGINDAGTVVGWSDDRYSGSFLYHTWTNGVRTDLQLPGLPVGINSSGQIVGVDGLLSFVTLNGVVTSFGVPGETRSVATAINDSGTVVGNYYDNYGSGAFLRAGSSVTLLSQPAGSYAKANAINNLGVVAGAVRTGSTSQGATWLDGARTVQSNFTVVRDINDRGWMVGVGPDLSPRLQTGAGSFRLSELGQGSVDIADVLAINELGQMTGRTFDSRSYLITLTTNTWQGAGNGSWDDASRWAYGINPNELAQIYLQAPASATITGPLGDARVRGLMVGSDAYNSSATTTTLRLDSSRIVVEGDGFDALRIAQRGVLTGRGEIALSNYYGVAYNQGRIEADDLTLRNASLLNTGVIEGHGRLAVEYGVANQGGQVRVGAEQCLNIDFYLSNYYGGRIDIIGGELEVTGDLYNEARLLMVGGVLRGNAYNQTGGRIEVGAGSSVMLGNSINWDGAQLIVSGGGALTLDGRFDNRGEVRVSANASATFFSDFYTFAGASLTGSGWKYFEDGVFIDGVMQLVQADGDVGLGSQSAVHMLLGSGGSHRLAVADTLRFDGTLVLQGEASFVAAIGQSFDLFDWGGSSGQFSAVDASGLRLANGARLDLSRLYLDGTVSVAAVHEPGTWALWLVGLVAGGGLNRRRSTAAGAAQRG